MTNDELKKKISQIIAEYCCPLGKTHKQLYGAERQCYTEMNFAECKPITECTDALIAARIGEVKETKHRAEIMELALDKMAEFVYETSAEQEMWKKEFIKQAEKELAEEEKDD